MLKSKSKPHRVSFGFRRDKHVNFKFWLH